MSFTQTPAYERSNAENKRESLSNTTVINDNVPCLNNVATLTADVISALLASQEIPFELHGAFLGTRGNKIQKDARKKVTDLNLSAYPMRKVTNAKIRVPVINYSDKLEADQKQLLDSINNIIIKKYDFLNDINKLHFKVSQDNVHWSAGTAQMILEAWAEQLNS